MYLSCNLFERHHHHRRTHNPHTSLSRNRIHCTLLSSQIPFNARTLSRRKRAQPRSAYTRFSTRPRPLYLDSHSSTKLQPRPLPHLEDDILDEVIAEFISSQVTIAIRKPPSRETSKPRIYKGENTLARIRFKLSPSEILWITNRTSSHHLCTLQFTIIRLNVWERINLLKLRRKRCILKRARAQPRLDSDPFPNLWTLAPPFLSPTTTLPRSDLRPRSRELLRHRRCTTRHPRPRRRQDPEVRLGQRLTGNYPLRRW
jgi:hypothetical protein